MRVFHEELNLVDAFSYKPGNDRIKKGHDGIVRDSNLRKNVFT